VERLLQSQRQVTLYYSNSNICSREEFDRRLASVKILSDAFKIPLLVDEYNHEAWLRHIQGLEQEPERGARCTKCFGFSLGRTAAKATELGMNFATTLTVSPHKNSKVIFSVGTQWPHFECLDFKKQNGFLRGRQIARELGFYLQNFCGCDYSLSSSRE
jgi:hypothetical protein